MCITPPNTERRLSRRVLPAIVAGLLFAALAPSAYAGTNGQQIALNAPSQHSVKICGANQRGYSSCRIFNTTYGVNYIGGYWYVGNVTLTHYADANGQWQLGTSSCYVPRVQTGDWTSCNGMPGRGNVRQINKYAWGLRIWLTHDGAQSAWRSVAASGNFDNLDKIPVIGLGPFGKVVKAALSYPACIGRFVNSVKASDVGYGVVMDVNWWAPFWACGSMKAWSQ